MDEKSYVEEYDVDSSNHFLAALLLFAGILVGALAGSATTLLLAPQSGKRTRLQIQRSVKNLRKQTARAVDDGVDQARDKAHDVSISIHEHAEELQQLGQTRR